MKNALYAALYCVTIITVIVALFFIQTYRWGSCS
jgi:hypothetical protein